MLAQEANKYAARIFHHSYFHEDCCKEVNVTPLLLPVFPLLLFLREDLEGRRGVCIHQRHPASRSS